MLIRLFNPSDLIGCGDDINHSDSVGLCGSTWLYMALCGSTWGLFLRGCGEKSGFHVN